VRESCGIAAFAILALLAGLTEPVIASFVPAKGLLYAIFVLDGAFFVFAVGLTTYVSRIAPASEHTPTLSMGVAMNHVAAVTMPFLGGLLWNSLGYRWAFLIGIPAAVASILIVLRLPRETLPSASADLQPGRDRLY
jgi:predicted MFS family arabinose efflux permease